MRKRWIRILLRFWRRLDSHDVFGISAKCAYYLLLSFFPLTLLLLSVSAGLELDIFEIIIPSSVLSVLEGLTTRPGGEMTAVSAFLLIWSSSTSIRALMRGVFAAHTGTLNEKLKRGRLWALLFTLFLVAAVFICVSVTLLSALAVERLTARFAWYARYGIMAARLLFISCLIFLFTLTLYYLTPGDKMRFRELRFGAALASVCWLAASWGFEIYMRQFNNYSLLYGAVGAFLGLALWLYIISFVLLSGAEMNAFLFEENKGRVLRYPGDTDLTL